MLSNYKVYKSLDFRTPELALLPQETKKVLERLSNMPDLNIVIISGREMEDLRRKVGVEGISYAANHGLNILHPDGHQYRHQVRNKSR